MSTRRNFLKVGTMALASQAALLACKSSKEEEKKVPKDQIKWKMITSWPSDMPGLGTSAKRLAHYINELSEGKMDVSVHGAGDIVPAHEVFDAVQRGTADIGHGAAYYWQDKHEATSFFTAVPFGLNATEMNSWIYHGGGQALWDELYAPYGVRPFCAGNTGAQTGGWFNKEIISLQSFKGLKVRMPGLGGRVLSELGVQIVDLPVHEILEALKTKAIDAAEWVGPYNDFEMGLHTVSKFCYWPGWQEPSCVIEAIVNKKSFDALPKNLQIVVERSCQCVNTEMSAEYYLNNAQALNTLVNEKKVILKAFPDVVLKKMHEISNELVLKISRKDQISKKIYTSFEKALKMSYHWNEISETAFSKARML